MNVAAALQYLKLAGHSFPIEHVEDWRNFDTPEFNSYGRVYIATYYPNGDRAHGTTQRAVFAASWSYGLALAYAVAPDDYALWQLQCANMPYTELQERLPL